MIVTCFRNGNKLLICGNGGSAAMASHLACEFMGKFERERPPLPAISLVTDSSFITAWSNDYVHGFDTIFVRQVTALGNRGDILIVFSTSGKSQNCLYAIEEAKKIGMGIIDWPREGNGTAQIQEFQFKLMHNVCREVEREFL